jgi:tRNA(Arg) A34 adenosine deaminase TadA
MKNLEYYYFYMNLLKSTHKPSTQVPIGCVLINEHEEYIIRWNGEAIDHCELLAIQAALLQQWDLTKATIIVSCEPCSMCLTALCLVKIKTIVFGCYNEIFGALGGNFNLLNINGHLFKPVIIGGIMEDVWATLLKDFFKTIRP